VKLWYQGLARQDASGDYHAMLLRVLTACADPGTTIHLQGQLEGAGIGAHYRFLEYHDTKEVIYNALRAQREGYDAFLMGNISDAGVREARELVDIPVLGICETCLHLACIMGTNYGLVSISPKWSQKVLDNVLRYGMEAKLVGIEPMLTSSVDLKQGFSDSGRRQAFIAEFMQCGRRLIERGAECIIPAAGNVMTFLAEERIFQCEGAPILNGNIELIKMGELAVRLKALTGRFTSKRLTFAPLEGELLLHVRKHYGPDVYPGA